MIKTFLLFCKRLLTSKLGLFLVITHLVIVIYEFSPMISNSDMPCEGRKVWAGNILLAGRLIHWNNESLVLQSVILLDLPAIMVANVVLPLSSSLNLCRYTQSWVEAIILLIFASLQWLLIGFGLQEFVRSLKKVK
jgi:hypothetical protein